VSGGLSLSELLNDETNYSDDPYFYLYYGTEPRTASYFSLETTVSPEMGRVVRFDSFSKILSAGMRIGFMSAPDAIYDVIEKHVSFSLIVVLLLFVLVSPSFLDGRAGLVLL